MSSRPSVSAENIALVDSSAIVCLVDRNEANHEAAVAAYKDLLAQGYKLFTTSFVVSEAVELLTTGMGAEIARQFLRDHRLPVYHTDEQDEQRAKALVMSSTSQRGLSFVDAVSLVVMERLGVADAFAVDTSFLSEAE